MSQGNRFIGDTPHISIAPMMDWTDRHCRYFHRLISPHVRLYTEMVTTGAMIHGDCERFLRFNAEEPPVALQLGGSDPAALAECAKIGEDYGYDEINLNCGCPSDRVQSGNFGACLMAEPELVAECYAAMAEKVDIPVTIKCRIAIDEEEEFPFLNKFIESISKAGCQNFIVHARKAWLNGLSPKENRDIPPLRHDIVSQIKTLYPDLNFVLNGGIKTLEQTQENLDAFDGVMIGREAYSNPYLLSELEQEIYGNTSIKSREDIALSMIPYIERQQKDYGTPVKSITRHMIGLYHQIPGAKQWRRYISENAHTADNAETLIKGALEAADISNNRRFAA